jgi:hypothetical protein
VRFTSDDGISDFVVAVDDPIKFDFDGDASEFHSKLAPCRAKEAKREDAEITLALQKSARIAAKQGAARDNS